MVQLSFADLPGDEAFASASLADLTLVVVDLETTGGSPDNDAITEIGAVKIRGGEILGEFGTLVDPGRSIPPQIVTLTGITSAMVHDAPRIEEVLPSFFEFARGAVLVAHNARFDVGFLKRAAARQHLPWSFPAALCTVAMARRILTRQEAPTVKLGALADLFDVTVRPTHRALDDARATVEVFHHLLERVGNQDVRTYRDLTAYLPRGTPALRAKRSLADGLPDRPGVYLFRGPGDEVLYIGTAVNLRRRVGSYFTGADTRARMAQMVGLAERVDHIECAHALEAGVRELTLIAAHKPTFNRRSANPHRGWWITLTGDQVPRLKVSRTPSEVCFGPVSGRTMAAEIAASVTEAAADPGQLRELLAGRSDDVLDTLTQRLAELADARRFETAARARDALAATIDALARCQRLSAIARLDELVLARPAEGGGWEFAVVRHGRLAGAGCAPRDVPPMPVVATLVAGAQHIPAPESSAGPLAGAPPEEVALIAKWIGEPGTRLVSVDGELSSPLAAAERRRQFTRAAREARTLARDSRLGSEHDHRHRPHRSRHSSDPGDRAGRRRYPGRH
ncbi:DEDD exonuclease domain-containing protein [Gordonia alkaliphila]|uniref:DEDD exonuclease domain-containing protein n=1 Tax=Gordonia alkaliphila TaxID=1053547 RepID=A0ABP8Z537_9ACTN